MIPIRLRIPLCLKSRAQRADEALFGIVLPPALVVPARTTLRVVDLLTSGAYALTPDGVHVLVSAATIREHGYAPRSRQT